MLLVFHNNVYNNRLGSKTILKLDFLRSFDNPLSKYLIYKSFLNVLAILCVIYQIQMDSWVFFLGLIFSKIFHESFPYAILHQLINFRYQFVFLNLCHALYDLSSSSFFYKFFSKIVEEEYSNMWRSWERKKVFWSNKKDFFLIKCFVFVKYTKIRRRF